MKLTILSVAYPFAPVSGDSVGGAEQILAHLDRAICEAGHHSIVLACEGSSVKGTLITVGKVPREIDDGGREFVYQKYTAELNRIVRAEEIDLVHFHGIDFDHYLPTEQAPVLVTLHLPPDWYSTRALRLSRPNLFFNCVSHSQHACCPTDLRAPVIENGISIPDLVPLKDRQWAASLGRICPEKGFHLALDAAQMAGVTLRMGGYVFPYPAHQRYFNDEIAPRLSSGPNRFLGPVTQAEKQDLLAGAHCLLVTSLAKETSSLVAMEALACGTPVIAFRSGALQEIVEHGKTGFLVNSVDEMAEAIKRTAEISPDDCRMAARKRFSLSRMTAQYLALYQQVAAPARQMRWAAS